MNIEKVTYVSSPANSVFCTHLYHVPFFAQFESCVSRIKHIKQILFLRVEGLVACSPPPPSGWSGIKAPGSAPQCWHRSNKTL